MIENKHEEKSHYANVRIFMGMLVAPSVSTIKQNRCFSSPSHIKQSEINFYISTIFVTTATTTTTSTTTATAVVATATVLLLQPLVLLLSLLLIRYNK